MLASAKMIKTYGGYMQKLDGGSAVARPHGMREVAGSNPAESITIFGVSQGIEMALYTVSRHVI